METRSKDSIEPQAGQRVAEMRLLEVNNVIRCTYKGQCGSQLELSTHHSQMFIALLIHFQFAVASLRLSYSQSPHYLTKVLSLKVISD